MSQASEISDRMMDGLWIAIWEAVLRFAPYVIPMFLLIFLVKYLFGPNRKKRRR
ncbi:MAG: hypothetical protein NTV46_20195 [Verrucomicrobia bacterium]|nr:hypothetical protein [Verrucomicrobiota bacterium]